MCLSWGGDLEAEVLLLMNKGGDLDAEDLLYFSREFILLINWVFIYESCISGVNLKGEAGRTFSLNGD